LPISYKNWDTFTEICGHKQKWNDKELIAVDGGSPENVRLVIQSIKAYRRFFDELDAGMTARLKLTGEGLEKLVAGKILGNGNTIS
jgi:hypothetical protein